MVLAFQEHAGATAPTEELRAGEEPRGFIYEPTHAPRCSPMDMWKAYPPPEALTRETFQGLSSRLT